VLGRPPSEPLLTHAELDGLLTMVMRIDHGTSRILRLLEGEDDEEEEENGS
jgi:hypothetical protein